MEEEQELHASSADALQTAGTAAAARGRRCEKTGTALPRRGGSRPRDTCPMRAARGGRGHRVSVTTTRGPETKRRQLTRVRNGGAVAGPACVSSSIPGRAPRPGAISPQLPLPQRAWLPLISRGARSTAQTRSQGCGGRVCSAAVSAGVPSPFGCRRGRTAGGRSDSAGCADTTLFRQQLPVPHPRRELRRAPTSPVSPAFAIPRRRQPPHRV